MINTLEENSMKGLIKGDKKSFELLFLHYQPKLVHFISGFVKDSELARDMAQDVFLSIWNNREKLSEIKSFKAYLFKMGKNAVCNFYDHSLVNDKFEAEQLSRPADTDSIEETLFARELEGLIEIAVCQMPAQRRLIYTMSRIEGVNNSEIAERLHLNKRTVENHLTAALADVRKKVKLWSTLFL
ncbi:MAG TPA: RNA polymerase sigma-70 factor [Paludibacter sp.]|nr:RNA polymerase sigma-70 factor [Paludibacter sp.]